MASHGCLEMFNLHSMGCMIDFSIQIKSEAASTDVEASRLPSVQGIFQNLSSPKIGILPNSERKSQKR